MFGSAPANDVELRLHQLEQRAPSVELPSVQVTVDSSGATPVPVLTDPLDYNVGGWASYATLTPAVSEDGIPSGTWSDGPEGFLPPQAHRIGNVIFLAGMIRRVGPDVDANVAVNSVMFRLPATWRPARTVMLGCPCASANPPSAALGGGRAMVMVTPNLGQNAGLVTLVTTSVPLASGIGWVSLTGTFPAVYMGDAPV